ncbi:MAG: recombinase family protein [Lyngbya sp.]|nr:recombinase family protein [Lyngbya sp.]
MSRLIGYARVSSKEQNLYRQLDELKKHKCDEIFKDKMSGATNKRPELQKCLESLQPGDCLVVASIDRLGRNMLGVASLLHELDEQDINFRSLKEGFDYRSPFGKMFILMAAGFAEMEREQIRDRQREGIAAARKRGVSLGGKAPIDEVKLTAVKAYIDKGFSVSAACKIVGIGTKTWYRHRHRIQSK